MDAFPVSLDVSVSIGRFGHAWVWERGRERVEDSGRILSYRFLSRETGKRKIDPEILLCLTPPRPIPFSGEKGYGRKQTFSLLSPLPLVHAHANLVRLKEGEPGCWGWRLGEPRRGERPRQGTPRPRPPLPSLSRKPFFSPDKDGILQH